MKKGSYFLCADHLCTEKELLNDTGLFIRNGIIEAVDIRESDLAKDCDYQPIRLPGCMLFPGLIEQHIHGSHGVDTMDATPEAIVNMSDYLAKNGVTSFLCATVTSPIERLCAALKNVGDCMRSTLPGARLLGAYLEGPYIAQEYRGAHAAELIRELSLEELDELLTCAPGVVKIVAIAPEKMLALESVRFLTEKGIRVSMGHSNATYIQSKKW